jgi:DNA-binding NarL/FixJ family response regulator
MTRVLVCAAVRLYREGLAAVLDSCDGLEVVATAGTTTEALALVDERQPDVVLADTTLPENEGLIRALSHGATNIHVIALGLRECEDDIIAYSEAGATALVTRDSSIEELILTIDRAVDGELRCSPVVAAVLLRRVRSLAAASKALRPDVALTRRELEILALVDQGLSNKQIGSELLIQVPTVKNHVHNILAKLDVERRSEAAAWLRGT